MVPLAPVPGIGASVLDAIGRTPLIALDRLAEGLPGRVLAKLEAFGPGCSVKDRIALRMVEEAERSGDLKPGGAIVELTSGNTGIGLAIVAAVKDYRFYAVMSAGNSVERRRMLTALGAEVELVPQAPGSQPGEVSGEDLRLVEVAAEALTQKLGAWRPDQFANPANTLAHEETTAAEIWEQTAGCLHVWVASVGTGGTFTGTARGLKRRNARIRCIAAEPASARRLAGLPIENPAHKIQGTGYGMIPPQWDPALCDGTLGVSDEDAIAATRLLATREGIFAGVSSGANVWAAMQIARECAPGQVIVTVCPDTGLKYLSTDLFPE